MAAKKTDDKKLKMPRVGQVTGTSGLEHSGGQITIDPLKSLHGEKGIALYHEMCSNSSVIGAIRFLVRTWVTQADWYMDPADASSQARDVADFAESCMHDMSHSWVDFVGDGLTMTDYGWAWHEIVYKIRRGEEGKDPALYSQYTDGKIGWQMLPMRSQLSWFEWKIENDRLVGMVQNDPSNSNGAVLIPLDKSIHFRTETTNNSPEGRSLYRNAIVDWYSLKRLCEYEAISIERDLAGLPVMHVPMEVLQDGSAANTAILPYLQTALAQLKRDERLYLILPPKMDPQGNPTGYDFELLASPGRHQIDTTKVKQQYRAAIMQTVLAQFLEFGVAQHGSFSLSSSATSNFAQGLGAIMDIFARGFNRQAITPLMRLNHVPREYWPTLKHGDIEVPDLKEVGAYILSLAKAGIDVSDDKTAAQLRRYANLPDDVESMHSHADPAVAVRADDTDG